MATNARHGGGGERYVTLGLKAHDCEGRDARRQTARLGEEPALAAAGDTGDQRGGRASRSRDDLRQRPELLGSSDEGGHAEEPTLGCRYRKEARFP